ncbi:ATP-binding protein [Paenibacillus cremeus]|uniref:histidine kinase n=1 Tax=Paenibacillus cremeus TaxID=2163881 RepID=A0A559K3K6_9BACL|nr:ATP-binding protein [Paenibacillus cremeus]TVY06722.1 diguanylate cyclase [Paenibacillus cremeus]
MNVKWIILIYSCIIFAYSLITGSATSPLLLALLAALYAISHFVSQRIPIHNLLQLVLLVAFHWSSGSEWCIPLYLLHLCREYRISSFNTAFSINIVLMLAFSAVSLSHNPDVSNYIPVAYTALSCLVLAYLYCKYIHDFEQQKQMFTNEKKHLTTHDSLTGLYNLQEFHKQFEKLVSSGDTVILVLIDCKDIKALNTTNGFQGVNKILKQVGQLLRIIFPDASLISRYGGDEFAIVLKCDDLQHTVHTITQQLASEFPKLTGIDIHFGIACHPVDGLTKDDLILVAEHSLYLMKRESWLKREEHMLRSEKLRVVGELASGMAHEIRNPLTTVKGFLQLSKASSYNIEPWYDLIMDEINRMSMLTAEFLQFSRPHVTQFKVQSIQKCIHRVISLLDSESTRLGHYIRFEPREEPILMMMDQDKMLQLLLNLVKNAFEAMPEQGQVHIKLLPIDQKVIIEITDTGKGIPESELEKIFIPFYTTKDSGTGLGLSICHKIVQDHEGTIEVESVKDEGTKFTLTLPTVSPKTTETTTKAAETTISA